VGGNSITAGTWGVLWMRVVTVKMEEYLVKELDKYAQEKGISRSEAIRKAVELYIRVKNPFNIIKYKKITLHS